MTHVSLSVHAGHDGPTVRPFMVVPFGRSGGERQGAKSSIAYSTKGA
jgi:hypothetical protein